MKKLTSAGLCYKVNYYRLKPVALKSAASRLKFIVDLKIPIWRFLTLLFDVLDDNFVRNITRTRYKVPPCPHVPTPECTAYPFVLHHQFPRRLPLEQFHQLTDGDMGRYRYEDMDMIFRHMPLDDLHIVTLAYLPDEISQPNRNVSTQYWLAVFRDPHDVILDVVNGMARFSIIFHTASILKSSPKGEGFSPIPRMGQ